MSLCSELHGFPLCFSKKEAGLGWRGSGWLPLGPGSPEMVRGRRRAHRRSSVSVRSVGPSGVQVRRSFSEGGAAGAVHSQVLRRERFLLAFGSFSSRQHVLQAGSQQARPVSAHSPWTWERALSQSSAVMISVFTRLWDQLLCRRRLAPNCHVPPSALGLPAGLKLF